MHVSTEQAVAIALKSLWTMFPDAHYIAVDFECNTHNRGAGQIRTESGWNVYVSHAGDHGVSVTEPVLADAVARAMRECSVQKAAKKSPPKVAVGRVSLN